MILYNANIGQMASYSHYWGAGILLGVTEWTQDSFLMHPNLQNGKNIISQHIITTFCWPLRHYMTILLIFMRYENEKTTVIEPQQEHMCANSLKAILLYDLSIPVLYKTNVINKIFQNPLCYLVKQILKRIINPKMKMLSSFTRVVPSLYGFLWWNTNANNILKE